MYKHVEAFAKYLDEHEIGVFDQDEGSLRPLNKSASETCSVLIHNERQDGHFEVVEIIRTPACHRKITDILSKTIPIK